MRVEVTLFDTVWGFRGLLIKVSLAPSQGFGVATLLTPFALLQLRGPHDFYGSDASTGTSVCVRICVRAHIDSLDNC